MSAVANDATNEETKDAADLEAGSTRTHSKAEQIDEPRSPLPAGAMAATQATGANPRGLRKAQSRFCSCNCSKSDFKLFMIRNLLAIGLASAVIVGLSWPWLGEQVSKPELGDYGNAVPTLLVIGM
jgi:hypothetical protein